MPYDDFGMQDQRSTLDFSRRLLSLPTHQKNREALHLQLQAPPTGFKSKQSIIPSLYLPHHLGSDGQLLQELHSIPSPNY